MAFSFQRLIDTGAEGKVGLEGSPCNFAPGCSVPIPASHFLRQILEGRAPGRFLDLDAIAGDGAAEETSLLIADDCRSDLKGSLGHDQDFGDDTLVEELLDESASGCRRSCGQVIPLGQSIRAFCDHGFSLI